ncbi:hypothetical protein GCM10010218_55990 [Streptomyces mashuensis]|uniref:3-dehydroquinate synthase C-terminal domain-containing protein n=1 Tax=Streptomyces mashuensis TaxID=33904 RepID=A0A919EEU6_9ACTN|nr:hypothetical protein [Streptomyces mashuensis]GHF67311.1 hypothetical protein GCM10010218_55990 [Streptomyces mashuensis]
MTSLLPSVTLDRSIGSGLAAFPLQVRAGPASWDGLTDAAHRLDAGGFLLVTDTGVPTPHVDRVLHHLRRAAPTRLLRTAPTDGNGTLPKDAVVVGLGGTGVVDAAARLAARGTRRPLLLPTTLPAMSDTALSLAGPAGPRPVPALVRAQLEFLGTLAPGAVRPGLYALVRHVLSVCPASYDQVCARLRPDGRYDAPALASFLALCADARTALTCYDPLEEGPAGAFRYGHAVADALRVLGVGALRYGDAVALGMLAAARCARSLGLLDAAGERAHHALLARWGAPAVLPAPVTPPDVLRVLRRDGGPGTVGMVLLDGLGRPHLTAGSTVTEVAHPTLSAALAPSRPPSPGRDRDRDPAGTGGSCARGGGTPSVVKDVTFRPRPGSRLP